MSARFEYERITGEELSALLATIEWQPKTFARIFGVRPDRLTKWIRGEEDAPPWVGVVVRMLAAHPANPPLARRLAADAIRTDRNRPEIEFPYRRESTE